MKIYRLTLATLLVLAALPSSSASEKLAVARSAVSRWVDVERTISREALEWQDKQQLLNDLIAVAKQENEKLKAEIAKAEQASSAAAARRAALVKDRDANSERTKQVREFVIQAEQRVRQLTARLPRPLADKLEPLVQRLPTDPKDTTVGVAARMQTVMGFIAEAQRFDRLVTVSEELRTDAAGQTREVRTIYFGLGAGYYVTADKTDAGVGRPTENGWSWQPQPELANTIHEAIISAQGKARDARFLALPVNLKETEK